MCSMEGQMVVGGNEGLGDVVIFSDGGASG